ncbi:MAG: hypothetical protein ACTSP4_01565 [Candidatus Hodarchaeales archaeon]
MFRDLDEKRLADIYVMSVNQKGIDPVERFHLAVEHIKSLKEMINRAQRVEK